MLTYESLYVFAYAIPIYQLLFYTVQLISFSKANLSRLYVGLLLLDMSVILFLVAMHHLGYFAMFSGLYYIFLPLILILFPLFYLYIIALTKPEDHSSFRFITILFSPPIAVLLLNLVFNKHDLDITQILSINFKEFILSGSALDFHIIYHFLLLTVGLPLLLVFQFVIASIKINKIFSSEKEIIQFNASHLAYLKPYYQYAILICLFVFVVGVLFPFTYYESVWLNMAIIVNLILLFSGGTIGFFALKQNRLLLEVVTLTPRKDSGTQEESVGTPGAEKFNFPTKNHQNDSPALYSENEIRENVLRLESMMNQEKPYLDPDFSMSELCKLMDSDRRKMTYLLNVVLKKNFYGFVNEYRMNDVIQLLENDENRFTIEAIAEKVGFHSKSSFYVCFKKYTGLTPKEYLSQQQ